MFSLKAALARLVASSNAVILIIIFDSFISLDREDILFEENMLYRPDGEQKCSHQL